VRWKDKLVDLFVLENGNFRDFCLDAEHKQKGGARCFEIIIES
jgi:hypothetical protein